jgi:hypothetical protein
MIAQYAHSLLTGDHMTTNPAEMPIEEVVQAWVLYKHVSDSIEKRMKAFREVLLAKAEQYGKPTDKGGQVLSVQATKVLREKRVSAAPPEKGVRELLEKHELPIDEAFSTVKKVVLDPSKLQVLMDLGKLPSDEVEALKKVTWALRVKPSDTLLDTLDDYFSDEQEELIEDPRPKKAKSGGKRKSKSKGK